MQGHPKIQGQPVGREAGGKADAALPDERMKTWSRYLNVRTWSASELLIRNRQVMGSTPIVGSRRKSLNTKRIQRGHPDRLFGLEILLSHFFNCKVISDLMLARTSRDIVRLRPIDKDSRTR